MATADPDMRILMLETHDFTPAHDRRRTTRYRAEKAYTVKRDRGDAMVAIGVAMEVAAPARREPEVKPPLKPRTRTGLGDWDRDGKPGGDAAATASAQLGVSAGAAIRPEAQPSFESEA